MRAKRALPKWLLTAKQKKKRVKEEKKAKQLKAREKKKRQKQTHKDYMEHTGGREKGIKKQWKLEKTKKDYLRRVGKWEGPYTDGKLNRGNRGAFYISKNGRKYPRYLSIKSVGRYGTFTKGEQPEGALGISIDK